MRIKRTGLHLVVVVIALMAFLAMPAQANNAAVRIDGQQCGLRDGNGNFVITTTEHAVITSSGAATLVCRAQVAPPSSGTAVVFNFENTGGFCLLLGAFTRNWQETVSASGMATFICHGRPGRF